MPQVVKSAFDVAENLESDPTGAKKDQLAEMFRAPTDIMTVEPIPQATERAERERKFLMVNVIDPTNFMSLVQNRDLWKDKTVKEIVKSNFVFIQVPFFFLFFDLFHCLDSALIDLHPPANVHH